MPSYLPWSLLLLLLLLLLSGCLFLRLLLLLLLLLLLFCFFWSDVEECGGGGRAVCQSRPLIDGRRPSLVFFCFFCFFFRFVSLRSFVSLRTSFFVVCRFVCLFCFVSSSSVPYQFCIETVADDVLFVFLFFFVQEFIFFFLK